MSSCKERLRYLLRQKARLPPSLVYSLDIPETLGQDGRNVFCSFEDVWIEVVSWNKKNASKVAVSIVYEQIEE